MFKQRVTDWDLNKNYKAKERKDLAQIVKYYQETGEEPPKNILIRGQPVKMHKIRRDARDHQLSPRRRAELQELDKSIKTITAHEVSLEDLRKRMVLSSTPIPPLSTPAPLKYTETVLLQTKFFYDSFVRQDLLPGPKENSDAIQSWDLLATRPSWDFCNKVDAAFELLKESQQKAAFKMLDEASDMARPLFTSKDTDTLCMFLFNAADWSISVPSDIFKTFWRFLWQMAITVLGEKHPVTVICLLIACVEPGSPVYATAFQIIVPKLEEMLGPGHKLTLNVKDRYNVLLSWAGEDDQAERLQRQLVQHYDRYDPSSHDTLRAVYRLGRILERKGDYPEAEKVYLDAVQRRKQSSCRECPNITHLGAVFGLVDVQAHRKEYSVGEPLLREIIEECLNNPNRGKQDGSTLRAVGYLGRVLLAQGREQEYDDLKQQYPDAFDI